VVAGAHHLPTPLAIAGRGAAIQPRNVGLTRQYRCSQQL
jgi:hypothetical protein